MLLVDILWILFTFIPALIILVFVHELGHFWAARIFGMRVDRFSIGFPPNVLKKQYGQTEYVLGLTPLGGYVKIAGMVDESLDMEFNSSEPQPDEYRSKPLWQRMVVITAGVFMNIVLAFVIFFCISWADGGFRKAHTEDMSIFVADSTVAALDIGLQTGDQLIAISGKPFDPNDSPISFSSLVSGGLTFEVERRGQRLFLEGPENIMTRLQELPNDGYFGLGIYYTPTVLTQIIADMPAQKAGLKVGDEIVQINQVPVRYWQEVTEMIQHSNGDSLEIKYIRQSEQISTEYTATVVPEMDINCMYVIGIGTKDTQVDYGPFESLGNAWYKTWDTTFGITTSLWRIAIGKESVRDNLGGPIAVANVIGEAASRGADIFWGIVAILSLTLAIINILPIPVLDGGHLAFLFYELFVGKEPPLKVRVILQQVGMVILLVFMTFLITNDILRSFSSRDEPTLPEPPPTCYVEEIDAEIQ